MLVSASRIDIRENKVWMLMLHVGETLASIRPKKNELCRDLSFEGLYQQSFATREHHILQKTCQA